MTLASTKMGLHEWAYSNDYSSVKRQKMTHVDLEQRFKQHRHRGRARLHGGADGAGGGALPQLRRADACSPSGAASSATRASTSARSTASRSRKDGEEGELRKRLSAPSTNLKQDIFVSGGLPHTGRAMIKDEDLCVHCGLCAERCPTAAWDMQRFDLQIPYAGRPACTNKP
jgi:formate dehydrogenase beta subunit